MSPPIQDALTLLVQALIGLPLLVLIFRMLLQMVRADAHNPICEAIIRITNPLLTPLHRILPNFYRIDVACVLMVVVLGMVKLGVLLRIHELSINLESALVLSVGDSLDIIYWIFMLTILARAIASWLVTGYHPSIGLLISLTEPLLAPFRRLLPSLGGLDLSPLFAILTLQLIKKLLLSPLREFGLNLVNG